MLNVLESEIHLRQLKLANLFKRLFYLYQNHSKRSDYEKNEIEIIRIDTLFEIRKQRSILNKKKELFKEEFKKISEQL